MDTTPKYILMSEKARKWLDKYYMGMPGDLYVRKDNGKVSMVDTNILTDGVLHPDCIPLFRQDQLQEMINRDVGSLFEELSWTLTDIDNTDYWYMVNFETLEQLWLAFVMKEKYQKVWSTTKKGWVAQ